MRLELQQIGALCVALLLGGSVSLCLFLVMIFLIEPERTINSHTLHPYAVTFVVMGQKNKKKKTPDKSIEITKPSSNSWPTTIRADIPQKITRKKISVRLPEIGLMNVYRVRQGSISDLNFGMEENYHSKDNSELLFNQVERKYLRSKKMETLTPERVRIPGGEEIDRIGNTCFEVPGIGGSGGSDTGQTEVEKDESYAMRSLSAHQIPCNKVDNSLAQDFLKQLKKRRLIMAPVSVTK